MDWEGRGGGRREGGTGDWWFVNKFCCVDSGYSWLPLSLSSLIFSPPPPPPPLKKKKNLLVNLPRLSSVCTSVSALQRTFFSIPQFKCAGWKDEVGEGMGCSKGRPSYCQCQSQQTCVDSDAVTGTGTTILFMLLGISHCGVICLQERPLLPHTPPPPPPKKKKKKKNHTHTIDLKTECLGAGFV